MYNYILKVHLLSLKDYLLFITFSYINIIISILSINLYKVL